MESGNKADNRNHTDIRCPAHGGIDAGYSFYIKGKKLHWVHNYVAKALYHVESGENVPEGRHQLRFEFEVTGKPDVANGKGTPGKAQLYIDGKLVGQAEVPVTTPLVLGLTSGITCGSAHAGKSRTGSLTRVHRVRN